MTHRGPQTRGRPIAPGIVDEVREHVEAVIAPFRHLRLERVSQYVSEIKGRPLLRQAVDVVLGGYAPSLHVATTSFRIALASIEINGVAEAVDMELQRHVDAYEARRRLALATFGHEVAPLPRDRVGHLSTGSLDIDLLVELEGGPEGAVRRIAEGVETVLSRREAGDHRATPPFSLQASAYDESIVLGDVIVRGGAILVPEMSDGLEIGRRIGDHATLPSTLRDAKVVLIRDERADGRLRASRRVVIGLDLHSRTVRIGTYLKERYGYALPDERAAVVPMPISPGARGEAVELAATVMEWWDGREGAEGVRPPPFIEMAKRILGR